MSFLDLKQDLDSFIDGLNTLKEDEIQKSNAEYMIDTYEDVLEQQQQKMQALREAVCTIEEEMRKLDDQIQQDGKLEYVLEYVSNQTRNNSE